ncbi:MAG TPA: 30S ribosome-binding factor RbfA [Polyangiaceae bacterium]|nr:30S ribosome-binding factor RbfA [Polyangiaceae bacterium]
MTNETGLRARRVAAQVRARITEALAREVSDPALAGLVVSDVTLPDDLGLVWVKVRLLVGGEDEKKRRTALRSLERAAGRIRRGLGPSLRLKRVPELRFVYDTGPDASDRVEELLAEIRADTKPKE